MAYDPDQQQKANLEYNRSRIEQGNQQKENTKLGSNFPARARLAFAQASAAKQAASDPIETGKKLLKKAAKKAIWHALKPILIAITPFLLKAVVIAFALLIMVIFLVAIFNIIGEAFT